MELLKKTLDGWWASGGTSAQAQAVIDRMTGTVSGEDDAIVAFVDSQVASGNWDLIEHFNHYGLQTEANSLIGWKSKTQTTVNTPTHTAGSGFVLDGVNQYIDSAIAPSLSVLFAQNDAIIGAFLKAYTADGAEAVLLSNGSTGIYLTDQDASNRLKSSFNDASNINTTSTGFMANTLYTMIRTGAADYDINTNKTLLATKTRTSTAPGVAGVLIGSKRPAANYLNGEVSSFVYGAGVGFDLDSFYDNLVILNTSLAAI